MMPESIIARARDIRLLLLDVDGVLTDGGLYLDDHGTPMKRFNVKDGQGLKLIMQFGIEVGIITKKQSNIVALRMQELGIKHVFQNQHDKLATTEQLLKQLQLDYAQTAYVGDDLPDLPVMQRVRLPITVADGHQTVQDHAIWCTNQPGGHGAVREVCDGLLKAQDVWQQSLEPFIR